MVRRSGAVLLLQQALHHHLRGDARMVGARLPQHVLAAHPLEADQDVLDGIVERVPHVQRARDIGRRDHDGEGIGLGAAARLEETAGFPFGIKPGFHFGRRKGLLEHGGILQPVLALGALNTSPRRHATSASAGELQAHLVLLDPDLAGRAGNAALHHEVELVRHQIGFAHASPVRRRNWRRERYSSSPISCC